MTSSKCDTLANEALEANSLCSQIDTEKTYTDVFTRNKSTGIYECKKGFDERYQRRAHSPDGVGRYPTLVDLRNMFSAGLDYGKRRAMGIRAQWDASFSNTINGYVKGSMFHDANGVEYISRVENNTAPLPTDGVSTAYWEVKKAHPFFLGNNVNTRNIHNPNSLKTTIAFIELETMLPLQPETTNLRIASFSGSDLFADLNGNKLECSGMVLFSTTVCWGTSSNLRYRERAHLAEGESDWDMTHKDDFSFSLKLSPYKDRYTDESHFGNYIEIASGERIEWDDGEYPVPRYLETRSPIKAVPIEKDKNYYLYLEYVKGRMYPMELHPNIPDKIYLEVYPYSLGVKLPSIA